ncbi:DUF3313 domain-containing protein [Phenylobacterium sp. J367]|uniref:DUF3313 domain-containing protein n=1 Tax=Phenylobacterium sp. J367 TaxID=2898435 RepID=UPI002151604D|nr:DUF3313 domain-containing protein [Phenylobacterium sp. J367]MCR5880317.1 DUF3313 domain-containing protein [Phenylobacterium sp. J367]
MKAYAALPLVLGLAACTSTPKPSGFLSDYQAVTPQKKAFRAAILERKAGPEVAAIKSVRIAPSRIHDGPAWLKEPQRRALEREIDAQLCFELSERYQIGGPEADAEVRAAVTRVKRTGRVGSAASAAASFFIPGPIGVRLPGSTGGLAAEAEMTGRNGEQLAAILWSRNAMVVGADTPSLSQVGDALQFIEAFADATAETMTAPGVKPPGPPKPDPCAEYGPRIRPEGFLAKFATGLYVPEMSAAKGGADK